MILDVKKVEKAFDGIKAINNVSFSLEKGEIVSIIGPNGAGKSTLFNILTGYHQKDSGVVIFEGEDISQMTPYQICWRGIGRSFQQSNLFKRMSAFENIQVAMIGGMRKNFQFLTPSKNMMKDEVAELLQSIGLQEKMATLSSNLSHGERRRLELGIALANNPKIVFFDEPCSGLTTEESRNLVSLIKELAVQRHLTVLLVEHKMEVVFAISNRILVLHEGQLIFEGNADEVRSSEEVMKVYLGEI